MYINVVNALLRFYEQKRPRLYISEIKVYELISPVSAVIYRSGDRACYSKDSNVVDCSSDHGYIIQRAINENTGIILIRAGNYYINRTIELKSNIALVGEGDRATTLVRTSNVVLLRAYSTSEVLHNIKLLNFRVFDNGYTSDLIHFFNVKDSVIGFLTLSNFAGIGIRVSGTGVLPLYSFWNAIHDILIETNIGYAGIVLEPPSPDTWIFRIRGVKPKYCIQVRSSGSYISDIWCAESEYIIDVNANMNIIKNVTFDLHKTAGIHINASNRNISGAIIDTCYISGDPDPNADLIRITVESGYSASNIIVRNLVASRQAQYRSIIGVEGGGVVEKLMVDGVYVPPSTSPSYVRYRNLTIDGVNVKVLNDPYM